jgi:hypothetical protein
MSRHLDILTTQQVCEAERKLLGLEATGAEGSALCLSGGGIRGAAFCLGVIQAFAARQMLSQFHYLSTVSGGGYIGAWLTRCIVAFKGDVLKTERQLNIFKSPAAAPNQPAAGELIRDEVVEPRQFDRLRRYTNYLTPSPGIASTDTWAGFVLIGRNTLVNWAVFVPLLLAAAAAPVFYTAVVAGLGTVRGSLLGFLIFLTLGAVAVMGNYHAAYNICMGLPSHLQRNARKDRAEQKFGLSTAEINCKIILPGMVWIFLLPVACAVVSHLQIPAVNGTPELRGVFFRPINASATPNAPGTITVSTSAGAMAGTLVLQPPPPPPPPPGPPEVPAGDKLLFALLPLAGLAVSTLAYERASQEARKHKRNYAAFRKNRVAWWVAAVLAAFFLWRGAILAQNEDPLWLAILGPAWVLTAESLRIIAYVAVRKGGYYGDLDREWLARISGSKIRTVLGITCIAVAAVLLPAMLIDRLQSTESWLTFTAGLLSGPLAAIGGASALTSFLPGTKPAKGDGGWLSSLPLNWIIAAVAVIFGILLIMLLGRVAEIIATLPLAGPSPAPLGLAARALLAIMVFVALVFSPWLIACARGDELLSTTPDIWARRLTLALLLTLAFLVYQWLNINMVQRAGRVLAGADGSLSDAICAATLAYSVAAFAATGAIGISTIVNLNHFSMHAVYRNRLVRAFLGAGRDGAPKDDRMPDRFTNFDPRDNFRMADTFPETESPDPLDDEIGHVRTLKVLFPVINVTLNRTTGKGTARAERQGAPFTITPMHCGSAALRSDKSPAATAPDAASPWPSGAYVKTADFAGGGKDRGAHDKRNGISLGTAMTISGAAVSPNKGYNASPFTAFLMTLFNVRLGAWLPNPGRNLGAPDGKGARIMRLSGPRNAIPTMLQELTGQSDDAGDYIYLSDGGHFDNLGLYEMLRRRCARIVVVDAGADPKYTGFDLGHALEIARTDFGVQVQFITPMKLGSKKLSLEAAYAKISYPPETPGGAAAEGSLIYLKPWLPDNLPVDLQAYRKLRPDFPHTATADQFFTENDFEAYRHLGEYLANKMLGMIPPPDFTMEGLFNEARSRAEVAGKAASDNPPKPPPAAP